nr:MAG TPA: Rho termination factor, N-terminal domain [Caudoviricetes sp.]
MKKLIAKRPVLYLGRMYDAGDTLPANDQKMVTAWLNAKSAEWGGQEAQESRQEAKESAEQADGSQGSQEQNEGQEAEENGQEAEMVEGHLDAEQLATMKKAELEQLAADLGVDISNAKNNRERAELIAAVPVQAPAKEAGSAQ